LWWDGSAATPKKRAASTAAPIGMEMLSYMNTTGSWPLCTNGMEADDARSGRENVRHRWHGNPHCSIPGCGTGSG